MLAPTPFPPSAPAAASLRREALCLRLPAQPCVPAASLPSAADRDDDGDGGRLLRLDVLQPARRVRADGSRHAVKGLAADRHQQGLCRASPPPPPALPQKGDSAKKGKDSLADVLISPPSPPPHTPFCPLDGQFSPTYPAKLVVPAKISDAVLAYAAKYRSKERVPALTYLHWANFVGPPPPPSTPSPSLRLPGREPGRR